MNTRWMILTILAASQLSWAQDPLDFRVSIYRLNENDQQELQSLKKSKDRWKQVLVDQQSKVNEDVQEVEYEVFLENVFTSLERKLPSWDVGVMLDQDEWHESRIVRHKSIHALEYIPESEPKRYILRRVKPEPELSFRVKWNDTPTENEVAFDLEITRSSTIGRELVEGSTLNVGRPIYEHHSVTIKGTTTTFQSTKAYLWDDPDSSPLLIRIQAWDRKLPGADAGKEPTRPQYALESHTLVLHGPIEKGKSLDSEPPIGFTLISGNAIAFRFDADPGNRAHPSGDTASKALWDNVLEVFETFGVKATARQLRTTSAPRITNFIADPIGSTDAANDTLLLLLVANQEAKGYRWKQEITDVEQLDKETSHNRGRNYNNDPETAPGINSITTLIGRYHSFFSEQNQPIDYAMLKRMQWAIFADLSTHTFSIGYGKDKIFIPAVLGTAFVSRVTRSDREGNYTIDFSHLNRQNDNLPKSIQDTPEAIQAFNDSFRDSYFRFKYEAKDGETVGFFYSASPTEHYIVLNTMTLVE